MKKIEKLYLSTSRYNTAQLLEELRNEVLEKGGSIVKSRYGADLYQIQNRTITSAIVELTNKIERLESVKAKNEDLRKKTIAAHEKDLSKYRSIKNDFIEVHQVNYLYFILDGIYYYIDFDENPFFPARYYKIKIDETLKIVGSHYLDELQNKDMILNNIYDLENDNRAGALLLLETLQNAAFSVKYRNGKKRRVPNYYNNGYHYEMIYEPEKVTIIDPALIIKGA